MGADLAMGRPVDAGLETDTSVELVTLGEAMCLLVTDPPRSLRSARSFARSLCGSEANVAVGLARLGHSVAWLGRVGTDPFGEAILDALRAEGVDVSRAERDDEASTGLLVRDSHPERRVNVMYWRRDSAAARMGPEHLDLPLITSARMLHVTGITPALSTSCREAVEAALKAAKAAGVTISFDPNLRRRLWSDEEAAVTLQPFMEYVDVVLTGTDEARVLTGERSQLDVGRWFLDRGVTCIVVKKGADGAWATDGTNEWSTPAHRVTRVDSVGAGDAFAAGFLSALLHKLPIPCCLERAAVVAAMAVQMLGDIEGMPYRSELEAAMRGNGDDIDR